MPIGVGLEPPAFAGVVPQTQLDLTLTEPEAGWLLVGDGMSGPSSAAPLPLAEASPRPIRGPDAQLKPAALQPPVAYVVAPTHSAVVPAPSLRFPAVPGPSFTVKEVWYSVWIIPGRPDMTGLWKGKASWAIIEAALPGRRYRYSDGTRLVGCTSLNHAMETFMGEAEKHGVAVPPRLHGV